MEAECMMLIQKINELVALIQVAGLCLIPILAYTVLMALATYRRWY